MATFRKFDSFVEALAEGRHNLASDQLAIALSAVTPQATFTQRSDLTEISYTNLGSRLLTVSSSSQSAGVYSLVLTDAVLVATGAVPDFRYVTIYNTVNDLLVCWVDSGSTVSLGAGATYVIDFASPIVTITSP